MAPESGTLSSDIGPRMHALAQRLYPLCRSITGDGMRHTLRILSEGLPMTI